MQQLLYLVFSPTSTFDQTESTSTDSKINATQKLQIVSGRKSAVCILDQIKGHNILVGKVRLPKTYIFYTLHVTITCVHTLQHMAIHSLNASIYHKMEIYFF